MKALPTKVALFFLHSNQFFPLLRASAEEAIKTIHGTVIGQNTVRLSWGRSPNATKVNHSPHCRPNYYLSSLLALSKSCCLFKFFQDVAAAAWAPNPAQPYYAYGAYDPNYVYPTANDPNASYYAGYYQPQYQQPVSISHLLYLAFNLDGCSLFRTEQRIICRVLTALYLLCCSSDPSDLSSPKWSRLPSKSSEFSLLNLIIPSIFTALHSLSMAAYSR